MNLKKQENEKKLVQISRFKAKVKNEIRDLSGVMEKKNWNSVRGKFGQSNLRVQNWPKMR